MKTVRSLVTDIQDAEKQAKQFGDEYKSLRRKQRAGQKVDQNLVDGAMKQFYHWRNEVDTLVASFGGWAAYLNALGKPDKGKNEKLLREEAVFVQAYIETCAKYRTQAPSLTQLKDISGKDKSTWSRKLKDASFLIRLTVELKKKMNQAKGGTSQAKEEKVEFWHLTLKVIESKISHVSKSLAKKRKAEIEMKDEGDDGSTLVTTKWDNA